MNRTESDHDEPRFSLRNSPTRALSPAEPSALLASVPQTNVRQRRVKATTTGLILFAIAATAHASMALHAENALQVPAPQEAPPARKPATQEPAAKDSKDQESKSTDSEFQLVPPGKRRAIQGIGSVSGVSRVTFPSQPDVRQDLEFNYVFPGRARWRMSPAAEEPEEGEQADQKNSGRRGQRGHNAAAAARKQRHQMFRYGNGAWTIPPGSTTSEQHEGEALRIHMLRFEMRRLALIWPGELEWSKEDNVHRAVLAKVGSIEVHTDGPDGHPLQFRSLDPDGTVREEFKNIEWKLPTEEGTRREPVSWDLHFQGNHVWSETFKSIRWGGRLNDSFFRPKDRFAGGGLRASSKIEFTRIEIPEVAVWREDIQPEGRKDWDAAIQQAREAMERWRPLLEEREFQLDEYPVFLLDETGVPLRLELRLKDLPDYPPEKWFAQGGLEGLRRMGMGHSLANRNAISNLRGGCPEGQKPLDAYLALQLLENGEGISQLVVPITPDW